MLETVSLMGAGFIHALSPINLIAMFVSTALGITIGCLPVKADASQDVLQDGKGTATTAA